jgi:hypothetical protein
MDRMIKMGWKRKKGKDRLYGPNGTQVAIEQRFFEEHNRKTYHLTMRHPDGSWTAIYDVGDGIDFRNRLAAKMAGQQALKNL